LIHRNAIYKKSAKGAEAIAARLHGLSPRQRSLLIFIDGKRNVDELAKMGSTMGSFEQLLAELESGGFIEDANSAEAVLSALGAPTSDAATTVPASTLPAALSPAEGLVAARVAPRPGVTLEQAKRLAVRQLTDLLGPAAEVVCLHIEKSRTLPEFVETVKRARSMVRDMRGESTAERFASAVAANTPAS
jgi:hypothetical protein